MSGFANLCECICAQLAQQLSNIDSILSSTSSDPLSTPATGISSPSSLALVPPPSSRHASPLSNMSPLPIVMITLFSLLFFLFLTVRQEQNKRNQNRFEEISIEKPTHPAPDSRRDDDDNEVN